MLEVRHLTTFEQIKLTMLIILSLTMLKRVESYHVPSSEAFIVLNY